MKQQIGMTLTSLMIGMALGLFIIAGAAQLLIATQHSYSQSSAYSELDTVGRSALRYVSHDVEFAGFYGGMMPADIAYASSVDAFTAVCRDPGATSLERVINPYCLDAYIHSQSTAYAFMSAIKENTDVVLIKRVMGNPITDAAKLTPDEAYVIGNKLVGYLVEPQAEGVNSSWFKAGGRTGLGSAYLLRAYAYAVEDNGDGGGRLTRYEWDYSASQWRKRVVANNVDDLHLQFGVDTTNDGQPDLYASNANLGYAPNSLWRWDRVVSARIHLLSSSSTKSRELQGAFKYAYGDREVTYQDSRIRRLYPATVSLENPRLALRYGQYLE